jgi:hypothetical protein
LTRIMTGCFRVDFGKIKKGLMGINSCRCVIDRLTSFGDILFDYLRNRSVTLLTKLANKEEG